MDGLATQCGMVRQGGGSGADVYRSEVLSDNPTAYWRLGETTGTTAIDETGNHNSTSSSGVLINQPGIFPENTCWQFDAGTDRIIVNTNVGKITSEDITIEFWVNPTRNGSDSQAANAFLLARGWFQEDGWYMTRSSTGKISFATNQPGAMQVSVLNDNSVPLNVWSHVVVTRSGPTVKIYINGAEGNYDTIGTHINPTTTSKPLSIGNRDSASWCQEGDFDEVAIYPTALSASRILAHYNASGI